MAGTFEKRVLIGLGAVVMAIGCQGQVHVGGDLALEPEGHDHPAPPRLAQRVLDRLAVVDAEGTEVTDGSLGSVYLDDENKPRYRAPLRVPSGGSATVRDRQTGRDLWNVALTEGRATYIRPFDALSREPGGVAGLPALPKAARESEETGRARIIAELERSRAAGFNTLLIEAFYHGYTMWPTTVGRQRPSTISGGVTVYANNNPIAGQVVSTWDPLRVYIEEAHARGMEIHVWFETFYVWTRFLQSAPFRTPSTSSWYWNLHRDWFNTKREVSGVNAAGEAVSVSEDGKYFLDPRNPEVQAHILALIEELYTNYPDLDGLQLDYIRYPRHTSGATIPSWYGTGTPFYDYFGFNPVTFAQFEAETGYTAAQLDPRNPTGPAWEAFNAWKTEGVTSLVRSVHQLTETMAPDVAISVSVFPGTEDRATKMQDSMGWVDEGLVDIVMPQLYYTNIATVERVGDPFMDQLRGRVNVYPTFFLSHFVDDARGVLRPEGPRYLDYAARRNVEGVAVFLLTGASGGISAATAAQFTAPGAQFEHPAVPTHRRINP